MPRHVEWISFGAIGNKDEDRYLVTSQSFCCLKFLVYCSELSTEFPTGPFSSPCCITSMQFCSLSGSYLLTSSLPLSALTPLKCGHCSAVTGVNWCSTTSASRLA